MNGVATTSYESDAIDIVVAVVNESEITDDAIVNAAAYDESDAIDGVVASENESKAIDVVVVAPDESKAIDDVIGCGSK